MKILFIGDPHIKTDNGESVDLLLLEIRRITSDEKYDMIIVGGDVMHYHERLFTQALNKSLQFMDTLRQIAPTYVLIGNHDAINNSIFLTDQHWMNALKSWSGLHIVDDVTIVGSIGLCPYVPPGRLVEAFETKLQQEQWMEKKVWFVHQEIRGCRMGAVLSLDGDEWSEDWPMIVSGHIHDHQQPQQNVYYPGTPLQHSFGDSDVRVLTKIEVDEKYETPSITFIPINVPVKKVIRGTISSIDKMMGMIAKERERNQNIAFKIKLEASTAEFGVFKQTKEYQSIIQQGINVQLINVGVGNSNNSTLHNNTENIENIENIENNTHNFNHILERLVVEDEVIVQSLYDEIILEKIVLYNE
jgi:DNA repair exonuclease SbcCD nuclease subunit